MHDYLSESKYLTLEEFCFHSQSRKWSPGAKGKFRDVADAFRTVYWFNGLRIRLVGKARTIGALEWQVEPEAYGVSRLGVRYHRNKWRGYRSGRHTPLEQFVSKIDKKYEGSRMEFSHVLWDVLRLRLPIREHANDWVQRLEPSVQVLLWNAPTKSVLTGRTRRRRLNKRILKMLERRASLDALACLTLLLREAHDAGDTEYGFELGYWTCRMLLLTSIDLFAHGIANPLYEFYDQCILPLGLHDDLYRSYKGIPFPELIGRFSDALYHIEGVEPTRLTLDETRKYKQKILGWHYGFDYLELFDPIEIPFDPKLAELDVFRRYWNAQNMLRRWALEAKWYSPAERTPPTPLMREEAAARKALEQYQLKVGQRCDA